VIKFRYLILLYKIHFYFGLGGIVILLIIRKELKEMQRCPFQLRLLFQRRHWSRLSLYWWTCTLAIAASISYVGYLEVSSDSDRQSEALNQYINHIDDVPDQLVLQSINREEISSSETQYSSKSTFALNAFQICNFSIADQACYLCCFQKIVACRCKEILSFLGT